MIVKLVDLLEVFEKMDKNSFHFEYDTETEEDK
jgi:hypothetical protein